MMDSVFASARLYAAGMFVLGIDRYATTVAHAVAGVSGVVAVALFALGNTVSPVLQRPYLRLSSVAAAVAGGASVYQLLEQWRDPEVYSWIAAPLVVTGLQAAVAGYTRAVDASRPPVAARLVIELLFSFAFAVGGNSGQLGFTLARATAQILAILSLLGVVCLAFDSESGLAPVLAMERSFLSLVVAVIATRHVIGDATRAHSPELFQIGATACVALLLAPISLK